MKRLQILFFVMLGFQFGILHAQPSEPLPWLSDLVSKAVSESFSGNLCHHRYSLSGKDSWTEVGWSISDGPTIDSLYYRDGALEAQIDFHFPLTARSYSWNGQSPVFSTITLTGRIQLSINPAGTLSFVVDFEPSPVRSQEPAFEAIFRQNLDEIIEMQEPLLAETLHGYFSNPHFKISPRHEK